MRNFIKNFAAAAAMAVMIAASGFTSEAKDAGSIHAGIYADSIELSGMTVEEARQTVQEYVDSLEDVEITLLAADNNEVVTTAGEIGLSWSNPEIIEDAATLGKQGNIVQRYKALADLQRENKIYPIEFDVDGETVAALLEEKCTQFDVEAKDFTLTKENGAFKVVEGQTGYVLDVDASVETVSSYLREEWDHNPASIPLEIEVDEPKGSKEELSKVKDILGTYTTSFSSSGSSRTANVSNGAKLINGSTLYPGEEFSTYKAVAPFSADNGYYMAGSYLNGQVVESIGGGICQVSTTLYDAVLLAELEVTERHNHSMIVTYVDPSADAAIAESAGKDFRFVNNTDYPIYIEGLTTPDKRITFNIYGVETRSPSRTVKYESKVLEVINPTTEVIYTDASKPVGYSSSVQSAHIGYKAQLWKVVTENGAEVSREQINSSSYKMTPRSVTIGVSTPDPNIYDQIMAAVATNSIDYVRGVAAALATGTELPAAPGTEAPPENPGETPEGQQAENPPADVPAEQPPAEAPPAEAPPAEMPGEVPPI